MSLPRSSFRLKLKTPYMKTSRHSTPSSRWLLPVICFGLLTGQGYAAEPNQQPTAAEQLELVNALDAKLDRIVIPALQCDQSTLSDVLETIRAASRENDKATVKPEEKGINIFLKCSGSGKAHTDRVRITLDMKSCSLRQALEAIYCQTGFVWHTEPYAASFVAEY